MSIKNTKKGQSIIELLITIALASLFIPALLTGLFAGRSGRPEQQQRLAALSLLKEAQEVVRTLRDNNWANISTNGTYHPAVSGNFWTLVFGQESINGFTRTVDIADTQRDAAGNIVSSGGTIDPSTKQIVVTVTWDAPIHSSVSTTQYLTRHTNLAYMETTQTDFNRGTSTNVKVQASTSSSPTPTPDDGEIVLSQTGGFGDWCSPTLNFTALDLPKQGVANAVSAIAGQAAAGTGDNASGVSYANVLISDPSYPTAPVATVSGTFDGFKTNGVFTTTNNAYLATDTNHKQGEIIDLTSLNQSTGKYSEAGSLDIGTGSIKGQSIYVLGTTAYLTASDSKLYTFNITTQSGSHSPIGSVSLAGIGNKVIVVGTNAYVAVNSTTNQVQIVDVSDATHPNIPSGNSITATDPVSGKTGLQGRDIFVNIPQNRAYLVTAANTAANVPEFFLIDLSTKKIKGTYDTHAHGDMDPKGVVAVSGARAIIVGTGGQEYQVLKTSDESNPTWCGGLDIDTGINGISTVFTNAQRAYSYIITGDANAEFKIIEGGPGAGNGSYVSSGTFISQTIPIPNPLANLTAFNRVSATINQPVAGDVQMQIAVADAVNNVCPTLNSSYTFVGTDGTGTGTDKYYTTTNTGATTLNGTIPYGSYSPSFINPGKCLKYKVILNTVDSTLTPVFKDMTINYSP